MKKAKFFRLFFTTFLLIFILFSPACKKKEAKKEETIKIGAILPLTGSAAEWGVAMKNGMELAIDKINKKGGVNGKKIIIKYEDNQSEPKMAVSAINKLISTQEIPVILTIQSSVSLAIAPIANQNKVVLLCSAAHPDIIKMGEYIFRCYPTKEQLLDKIIETAIEVLNIDRIFIIYINDDYGISMKDGFEKRMIEKGKIILGADSFEKQQTNFRSLISKILAKKPKALFIPGYGMALGNLLKQLSEFGYSGVILSTQEVSYRDVLSIAENSANGVIYADMPFDPQSDLPHIKGFVNTYKAKYGAEPILDAVIGYDMTNLIIEIIKLNGFSADKIKTGLANVKEFNGLLGNLEMSSSREIIYPLVLKTIKNGKPTFYGE